MSLFTQPPPGLFDWQRGSHEYQGKLYNCPSDNEGILKNWPRTEAQ